jgi:hypothetical protein
MSRVAPIAALGLLAVLAAACGSRTSAPPPNDASGAAAPVSISLGPAEQILLPGDLGLFSVPDVQLSLIQQPDGAYDVWIGGTVSGNNGAVAMLSTTDFANYMPVVSAGGKATPVFTASAPMPCASGVPGSAAIDAQYAASGTVFPAANGKDLLMIYHAENHTFAGSCYKVLPFYATIGLARSADGGRSWTRQGAVITGRDSQPTTAPSMNAGWGAAVPASIVANGYVYTFYADYAVPGSGHSADNPIAVARAPVASDGAPGKWQKWSQGSFGTPGIGGDSTPIVPIAGTPCVFPRQPGISFNSYLKQYLLTMVCGAGWFFSLTSDLAAEAWSPPVQFFSAPVDNQRLQPGDEYDWHFALVTPGQTSGQTTGKTGFALWSRGGFPNTPIHMLWRRTFTLAP